MAGIAIRFVRGFDLAVGESRSSSFVMFGCGRSYVDDPEGAQRHRQSGCKKCRRYVRRMVAIARRGTVN